MDTVWEKTKAFEQVQSLTRYSRISGALFLGSLVELIAIDASTSTLARAGIWITLLISARVALRLSEIAEELRAQHQLN